MQDANAKPETTEEAAANRPRRLRYLAQFQGPPTGIAMNMAAAEIERLRDLVRHYADQWMVSDEELRRIHSV